MKTVKRAKETKEHKRSKKIDKILTNKYFGLPIFLAIMFLIFYLTFNVIGGFLSDMLARGVEITTLKIDNILSNIHINEILHRLVIDGICTGVGSVLSFLPLITTLFFFLSILEDTGYMARIAFMMDKLLRKIGLSGKSIVPLLLGFGCSVPAIMATRTLNNKRDRFFTILLIPFISCSAKLPIYSIFSFALFPKYSAFVMIGLYLTGIILGILASLILKRTIFKGEGMPFVMELPNYRMPSLKNVLLLMLEKAGDFIQKAFSIIFLASIVLWCMQNFNIKLEFIQDQTQSILAFISQKLVFIFKPLGFSDWRIVTSLFSGFMAKEAVIGSLSVLTGMNMLDLSVNIQNIFTPLSGISFLIFTLLYTPCIATIACIKKELNSRIKAISIIIIQCTIAWVIAFLVYNIGMQFINM